MQSAPKPDDIHAILSRFQNWAEKHAGQANGSGGKNGAASEQVREIPYEEAVRQYRGRRAAQTPRRAPTAAKKSAERPEQAAVTDAPRNEASEAVARWIAAIPQVAPGEPVMELKAATPTVVAEEPVADLARFAGVLEEAMATQDGAKPSSASARPASRAPKIQAAKSQAPWQASGAVLPDLPAQAFVDLPPATRASRRRPQRRTPPRLAQANSAVSAQPSPPHAASSSVIAPARPNSAVQPRPAPAKRSAASRQARRDPVAAAIAPGAPPRAPLTRAKAAVIRQRTNGVALKSGASAGRQVAAAPSARPKSRKAAPVPFRRVLANTLEQPKTTQAPRKQSTLDRTRRITTRFSPAEERRIEKLAAEFGITVSACLRQCALAALAAQNSARDAQPATRAAHARKAPAQASWQSTTYAAPGPSLLGGWLSLLRNRFLGPPVRISEDA